MSILYFDCSNGICGNMVLGALLEIVGDEAWWRAEIDKLHVDGYEIKITRPSVHGITGTLVDVIVDGADEYGHVHHLESHHHEHQHEDSSESVDHHMHHHHEHRHLSDVEEIIDHSDIAAGAKTLAKKIFRAVAEAEAKVHGEPLDHVHFHEVGAIDSIIDIVGTAILLDKINADKIIASILHEGHGFIDCAHGRLSVPVPATREILRAHHVPFRQIDVETELVTPTGAAIIATIADEFSLMPAMTVDTIGTGLGTKDLGWANVLTVSLGTESTAKPQMWVIETNIDDATGEELGFTLEQLLQAGAADVFYTPIMMKKNRPAYKLEVICTDKLRDELLEIIFRETTTIGARFYPVERAELTRSVATITTDYGQLQAKQVTTPAGATYIYPEYESMKQLAAAHDIPLKLLRQVVKKPLDR